MADYNDIKQSIATNLPDNNKREITAARLRDTLNGFVDKVQETETGIEGKVSTNESNIGNLSGRMDTNEANVTNLTGRVDSLEQTVENLPGGGDTVKVVDNIAFGGTKDTVSAKWIDTVSAIAGVGAANRYEWNSIRKCGFTFNKVTVLPGYLKDDGSIEEDPGYSYFEYNVRLNTEESPVYITIPGYGGNIVKSQPENRKLGVIYYYYDQHYGFRQYDAETYPEDICQHEVLMPYKTNKIRVSLVNGTFDPDNVYVLEASAASNRFRLEDFDKAINECKLPTYLKGSINSNGQIDVNTDDSISMVRLFKNDEIAVYTDICKDTRFSVLDRPAIWEQREVIYSTDYYQRRGWIYYKADRDCWAFIEKAGEYKVTRGSVFENDLQEQLDLLIRKIYPSFGEIILEGDGKGLHNIYTSGNKIVFKVPIVAGNTLNYTLNGGGTFTLGPVAYWYSGQPVATANIEHQATFSGNVLGIVGGTKSGYMLVTFVYSGEGDIPAETFNATYLEKNAQ